MLMNHEDDWGCWMLAMMERRRAGGKRKRGGRTEEEEGMGIHVCECVYIMRGVLYIGSPIDTPR